MMSLIIVVGLIATFEVLAWFGAFNKWTMRRAIKAREQRLLQRRQLQRPYDWAQEHDHNIIHLNRKGWHDEHKA